MDTFSFLFTWGLGLLFILFHCIVIFILATKSNSLGDISQILLPFLLSYFDLN